jgi:hypothetical protein
MNCFKPEKIGFQIFILNIDFSENVSLRYLIPFKKEITFDFLIWNRQSQGFKKRYNKNKIPGVYA